MTELRRDLGAVNAFAESIRHSIDELRTRLLVDEDALAHLQKHISGGGTSHEEGAESISVARSLVEGRRVALGRLREDLRVYCELNFTACYKAAKKHDKALAGERGGPVILRMVMLAAEAQPFMSLGSVELINRTGTEPALAGGSAEGGEQVSYSSSDECERQPEEAQGWWQGVDVEVGLLGFFGMHSARNTAGGGGLDALARTEFLKGSSSSLQSPKFIHPIEEAGEEERGEEQEDAFAELQGPTAASSTGLHVEEGVQGPGSAEDEESEGPLVQLLPQQRSSPPSKRETPPPSASASKLSSRSNSFVVGSGALFPGAAEESSPPRGAGVFAFGSLGGGAQESASSPSSPFFHAQLSAFRAALVALRETTDSALQLTSPELKQGASAIDLERGRIMRHLHLELVASFKAFEALCESAAGREGGGGSALRQVEEELERSSLQARLALFPLALNTLAGTIALTSPDTAAALQVMVGGYRSLLKEFLSKGAPGFRVPTEETLSLELIKAIKGEDAGGASSSSGTQEESGGEGLGKARSTALALEGSPSPAPPKATSARVLFGNPSFFAITHAKQGVSGAPRSAPPSRSEPAPVSTAALKLSLPPRSPRKPLQHSASLASLAVTPHGAPLSHSKVIPSLATLEQLGIPPEYFPSRAGAQDGGGGVGPQGSSAPLSTQQQEAASRLLSEANALATLEEGRGTSARDAGIRPAAGAAGAPFRALGAFVRLGRDMLQCLFFPTRGGATPSGGAVDDWGLSLAEREAQAFPTTLHWLWHVYRPAIFDWAPDYKPRKSLAGDVAAGVAIGVLLVPQGLACATLAGLAPIYGLFSGLPPIIYALFGSSRHAAIGPMSIPALMIFSGLQSAYAATDGALPPHPAQYAARVATVALWVGAIFLFMGWFRLGFILRFVSRPVFQGFTAAAAILTALSTAGDFLGTPVARTGIIQEYLPYIALALPRTHAVSLVSALLALAACTLLSRRVKTASLVVVVGSMALCAAVMRLSGDGGSPTGWGGATVSAAGVRLVGSVPTRLPTLALPLLSVEDMLRCLPCAASVAFVGFIESLAVAKKYAAEGGYEVAVGTELKALGATNALGSALMGTLPVMGAFGRSAVNVSSGATSAVSGIVSVLVVLALLTFAMPALFYLPKPVLAAIIVSGVAPLVNPAEFVRLWGADRADFYVMCAATVATLCLGVAWGVAAATGLSLVVFVAFTTQPRVEEVGRLEHSVVYKHIGMMGVNKVPGLKILRFLAPLFFANASVLKDRVAKELLARRLLPPRLKWRVLIICFQAVSQIDSTASGALGECAEECHAEGVPLVLSSMNFWVEGAVRQAGLLAKLGGGDASRGENFLYRRVHDAVRAALTGRVGLGGGARSRRKRAATRGGAAGDTPREGEGGGGEEAAGWGLFVFGRRLF